jgi:hypothetical protein
LEYEQSFGLADHRKSLFRLGQFSLASLLAFEHEQGPRVQLLGEVPDWNRASRVFRFCTISGPRVTNLWRRLFDQVMVESTHSELRLDDFSQRSSSATPEPNHGSHQLALRASAMAK